MTEALNDHHGHQIGIPFAETSRETSLKGQDQFVGQKARFSFKTGAEKFAMTYIPYSLLCQMLATICRVALTTRSSSAGVFLCAGAITKDVVHRSFARGVVRCSAIDAVNGFPGHHRVPWAEIPRKRKMGLVFFPKPILCRDTRQDLPSRVGSELRCSTTFCSSKGTVL
jgi:hypothetical protein